MAKENMLTRYKREKKDARTKELTENIKAKTRRTSKIELAEATFKELMEMSDEEIQKRLESIISQREEINQRLHGDENEDDALAYTYNYMSSSDEYYLLDQDKKLSKEQKRLEAFPNVRNQIKRIMELRDQTDKNKSAIISKLRHEIANNQVEILGLNKKLEEQEEARESLNDVNEAISIVSNYIERYRKSDIATMTTEQDKFSEALKQYAELQNNKKGLEEQLTVNIDEEKAKLQQKLSDLEGRLGTYINGESKEDSVINKCNMAWMMLLEGKSWDEIILKSGEIRQSKEEIEEQEEARKEAEKRSEERKQAAERRAVAREEDAKIEAELQEEERQEQEEEQAAREADEREEAQRIEKEMQAETMPEQTRKEISYNAVKRMEKAIKKAFEEGRDEGDIKEYIALADLGELDEDKSDKVLTSIASELDKFAYANSDRDKYDVISGLIEDYKDSLPTHNEKHIEDINALILAEQPFAERNRGNKILSKIPFFGKRIAEYYDRKAEEEADRIREEIQAEADRMRRIEEKIQEARAKLEEEKTQRNVATEVQRAQKEKESQERIEEKARQRQEARKEKTDKRADLRAEANSAEQARQEEERREAEEVEKEKQEEEKQEAEISGLKEKRQSFMKNLQAYANEENIDITVSDDKMKETEEKSAKAGTRSQIDAGGPEL